MHPSIASPSPSPSFYTSASQPSPTTWTPGLAPQSRTSFQVVVALLARCAHPRIYSSSSGSGLLLSTSRRSSPIFPLPHPPKSSLPRSSETIPSIPIPASIHGTDHPLNSCCVRIDCDNCTAAHGQLYHHPSPLSRNAEPHGDVRLPEFP